jgi:hypothetical protein
MGTVATQDALVTGGLQVQANRAALISNTRITAYDHTAPITLTRGGEVLVCSTSQFHLLRSGKAESLVFALDRGAFELRSPSQPQDVILTPDLRFTLATPGQLDLSLRVTPDGDTCVQNAGPHAPTLQIADAFSNITYRLMPGQHVLFEHGSLHSVVDNETSSCGCPSPNEPQLLANHSPAALQAAAEHPFPVAQSQGLAPTSPLPMPPQGQEQVQMSASLGYNGNQPTPTTPPLPNHRGFFQSIGHFFHKLFHPHS